MLTKRFLRQLKHVLIGNPAKERIIWMMYGPDQEVDSKPIRVFVLKVILPYFLAGIIAMLVEAFASAIFGVQEEDILGLLILVIFWIPLTGLLSIPLRIAASFLYETSAYLLSQLGEGIAGLYDALPEDRWEAEKRKKRKRMPLKNQLVDDEEPYRQISDLLLEEDEDGSSR